MDVSGFTERLKERIMSGVGFALSAYINKYASERLARRYLKEHSELGIGMGSALVYDLALKDRLAKYDPYLNKVIDGISDYGFWAEAKWKLLKEPLAYFSDANTIHVINMDIDTIDATSVKVYVDDAEVTVSGTEGEVGDFTISLSNPVDSGWHKVVIEAGNTKKDVFRGKLYVP